MKKSILIAIAAIVLGLGMLTVYVQGSDPPDRVNPAAPGTNFYCPNHSEISASWPAKCPKCGENLIRREGSPEKIKPGMTMNNPKAELMRHKVMMNTRISVLDPEAILGAARPLNLSPEQIERLKSISMTARQRAREVLTDSQRKQLTYLENLPNFPATMAERQRQLTQATPMPSMMNDPPSDPPAGGMSAEIDPPMNGTQLADNRYYPPDPYRDAYRDAYRDRYRDIYRDRFRDQYGSEQNYRDYREYYPYNNPFGYTDPYYPSPGNFSPYGNYRRYGYRPNSSGYGEFGENDDFNFEN